MNPPPCFCKGGMSPKLRMRSCADQFQNPPSTMPRPWVSTNLAVSADGKISSVTRLPASWTSAADHARLLELRGSADALLIGRGTLETDRMTLTVPTKTVQPLRCIVSRSGAVSPDHPVFRTPGGSIHLLATESPNHPPGLPATLHHQSLADFLQTLASSHGVKHLHCEGGGILIGALARLDAIDEFHLTLAGHTLFGGLSAPTATGLPEGFLPQSRDFEISRFDPSRETGECFLTYRRLRPQ